MSEGVEWAAHCCLLLDWLGDDRPVPTARLAAAHEVPPAYLNKQLQALVKAGILTSTPGVRGGFRLARPLEEITMMDVVAAVEGRDEAFRCTEIRMRGAGAEVSRRHRGSPCLVADTMREAEMAWRRTLASRTLADIRDRVNAYAPDLAPALQAWYAAP